jgi:hypothetical protein
VATHEAKPTRNLKRIELFHYELLLSKGFTRRSSGIGFAFHIDGILESNVHVVVGGLAVAHDLKKKNDF